MNADWTILPLLNHRVRPLARGVSPCIEKTVPLATRSGGSENCKFEYRLHLYFSLQPLQKSTSPAVFLRHPFAISESSNANNELDNISEIELNETAETTTEVGDELEEPVKNHSKPRGDITYDEDEFDHNFELDNTTVLEETITTFPNSKLNVIELPVESKSDENLASFHWSVWIFF